MANLNGREREKVGSRQARLLRARGRIPATVQGEGKAHRDISIDRDEFLTARRHHEHVFDIELGGGEPETTMVRELQWDPLGEDIVHVEFRRVVRGQETEAEVGLEFTGRPKSGVVNHLLTHVTVRTLPMNIPDSIEVPVGELEEGDSLHASDLVLPEGVSLALEPDTPIASVSGVRPALEPAEAEAEQDQVLAEAESEADAAQEEAEPAEPQD